MKLRYKILYMSFGAGLVVLGMMLNSLVSGDAEAQGGGDNTFLKNVFCENLVIRDKNGRWRGLFGLAKGYAILKIYGDDGESTVAYLGGNTTENNEMMLQFQSKSKTDKREACMQIDEYGGRFDTRNKMGENVIRLAVGDDGGGGLDVRDKFGYKR